MNRTISEDALRPMQHDYPPSQSAYSTTSFLKSKAMKLWPTGPHDQTTPKADPKSGRLHLEINPFDAAIASSTRTHTPTSPTAASVTTPTATTTVSVISSTPNEVPNGVPALSSPITTSLGPSNSRHNPSPHVNVHHKLLTSQLPSLSLPSRNKTPSPSNSPGGPNRSSPATTAISSTTATGTPTAVTPTRSATPTSITLPPRQDTSTSKEPMSPSVSSNPTLTASTIKPPQLRRNHTAQPSTSSIALTSSTSAHQGGPSRGQLHVKVLQARNLNVSSHLSRPYAVVQFEQSEFVSRGPIASENEKEVKGKAGPLSRTSSALALPSLSAAASGLSGGINKAFNSGSRINKATATTSATTAGDIASSLGSNSSSDESTNGVHSDSARARQTMTPRAYPDSGATTPGGGLFGAMSPHNPVWKHEVSFDVTSDQSLMYLSIYDRGQNGEDFIGRIEVKPVLVHDHTVDRWYPLQSLEYEAVTGQVRLQITYEQSHNKRALTPRDFEFLKLIGRGTFGKVFQVRKKDTRRIYAMKVLSKKEIIAKKEVAHTIGERKILQRSLECPFLVGLKFSFQTERDLYLVTDFKSGGELFWHLQRETKFMEERARFYIAELVLALEHLHKYDIMYRDLKPENILLDATGHVALCDFGLSKPDLKADQLTNTFCGTTEYLAPEVLLDDQGYSKTVDFWSLGVLLFEMCCGWSPFYAEDVQQMYKNICFGRIKFPRGVIGEDGKQFVKGLLNRNPKNRLGAQRDTAELKEHPFFKSIDWEALGKKQVTPPFKPNVESDESTDNFDPEFTSADLRETGIDIFDEDDEYDDWATSSTLHGGGTDSSAATVSGGDSPPRRSTNPVANGTVPGTMKGVANATASVGGRPGDDKARPTLGFGVPAVKNGVGRGAVAQTPISSSVQDHFRGFTFQGESTLDEAMDRGGYKNVGEEDAYRDGQEVTGVEDDEDDWEDEEPGGRYRKQRGHSDD